MTVSSPKQLERIFGEVEAGAGGTHGVARRRLLAGSRLDVFIEVRFPGLEWALVVHGEEQHGDRDLMLAGGLTCRTRGGSVEVVSRPETDRNLFCTLLADLITQLATTADGPAAALVRRLNAWHRMLRRGLPTGLSPEARIGLYGELLVLREIVIPILTGAAVRAWTGPSDAPQDFVHGSVAVEVKTVSRKDPDRCRISSERQLDPAAFSGMFLVHQVVGTAADGTSLPELIDELRCQPAIQEELPLFEDCLLEAGWLDGHRDQYANDRYVLVRRQCFAVRKGFPHMTGDDLPPGVCGLSYLIDLAACSSYRISEAAIKNSLASAGSAVEDS